MKKKTPAALLAQIPADLLATYRATRAAFAVALLKAAWKARSEDKEKTPATLAAYRAACEETKQAGQAEAAARAALLAATPARLRLRVSIALGFPISVHI